MCVPLERPDLYVGSGSPELAGELGVGDVMEQEHSVELEGTRKDPRKGAESPEPPRKAH